MKKPFLLLFAAILFIIMAFFFIQGVYAPVPESVQTTELGVSTVVSSETTDSIEDMIQVSFPMNNATISSPVTITGFARGPWYFEASFPIELRDGSNIIIASAIGQAQSDWMTENMVPFSAVLTFPTQPT